MNHIATRLASVTLLSLISLASSHAGSIAQPVGILTVPVVGPNKVNFLATPFAQPAIVEGTISAQTSGVLTVSTMPTMDSSLPYILEILDGDYIGAIGLITAQNTDAKTLTVGYSFPVGAIANGTRYAVRPDWTISTLLGVAATSKVGSSTSYGLGDILQVFNSTSGKFENFWRARTATTPYVYTWRTQAGVDASNKRIPLGEGFIIKRFSGTQLNLVLSGELRQARTRKEIVGDAKLNVIANPNPYPIKLSQSGLTPTASSSFAGADKLHFINPSNGKFQSYFRNSSQGNAWYSSGGVASGTVTIPAGGAVILQRNAGNGNLTGKSAAKLNPLGFSGAGGS